MPGDAVQFGDKGHYVRHVFDHVIRDDQIKFTVGEGIRDVAQVVNDVGRGPRIIVEADRPGRFVGTASDIQYLHRV